MLHKYSFVITVLSIILFAIISFTYLISQTLSSFQNHIQYEKFFEDFDSIIYVTSPSSEQIDIFVNDLDAEVLPYYLLNLNFSRTGSSFRSDMIIHDSQQDSLKTPYHPNRVLSDSGERGIGIDYYYAERLNLQLGDVLTFLFLGKTISLPITQVYEMNLMFSSGALFLDYQLFEELFDTHSLDYQGAFIKHNNLFEIYHDLRENYKPMGLFQPREEFQSDSDFDNYQEMFLNQDYSNRVQSLNKELMIGYGSSEDSIFTLARSEANQVSRLVYLSFLFIMFLNLSVHFITQFKSKKLAYLSKGLPFRQFRNYFVIQNLVYSLFSVTLVLASILLQTLMSPYFDVLMFNVMFYVPFILNLVATTLLSSGSIYLTFAIINKKILI